MENMIILLNDMKEWHKLFNNLLKNKNKNKKMLIAKLYNVITNKINIELSNNLSEEEIEQYYLKYNENINNFLSKLKKIYLDDEIDLYFNIIVPKKVARKLVF